MNKVVKVSVGLLFFAGFAVLAWVYKGQDVALGLLVGWALGIVYVSSVYRSSVHD